MATFDEINEGFLGPPVADYDPLRVAFSWGCPAPHPILWRAHYLAPVDGVTLETPVDMGREVGVWGESAVFELTDRSERLTVRVLASSPTATAFELAAKANRLSLKLGGPANRGPLTIADLNGIGRGVFCGDAVLEGGVKRIVYSGTAMLQEYVFLVDGVESFLAGLLG